LYSAYNLSKTELDLLKKIDNYFNPDDMSFQEKLFNALLIVQHEIEAQYYNNDLEKANIFKFRDTLITLLDKLPQE